MRAGSRRGVGVRNGGLDHLGDPELERLHVGDRLLEEVGGAVLHRGDGEFDRAIGGEQDGGEAGVNFAGAAEQGDAVLPWHTDVGDHQREVRGGAHDFERGVSVRRDQAFVARPEPARERVTERFFVVDNKYLRFHLSWRTRLSILGRRMVNAVPSPGVDSTEMVPPWSFTIRLETMSPRPVPFSLEVR